MTPRKKAQQAAQPEVAQPSEPHTLTDLPEVLAHVQVQQDEAQEDAATIYVDRPTGTVHLSVNPRLVDQELLTRYATRAAALLILEPFGKYRRMTVERYGANVKCEKQFEEAWESAAEGLQRLAFGLRGVPVLEE